MNKFPLFLMAFTLLAGCKVRKVAKSVSSLIEHKQLAISTTADSAKHDTSSKASFTAQQHADSANNELEIINESGAVQHLHIDQNGAIDYTGSGKSLKAKIHNQTQDKSTSHTLEAKGTAQKSSSTDATSQHSETNANVDTKSVKSSTDWLTILGLAIGIIFVIIFALAIYKTGKSPISLISGAISKVFSKSPPVL